MSKYTSELRFICESLVGLKKSVGFANANDVIKQAAPLVFDFPFPIWDEAYRQTLEEKIIRHYYTNEIGTETYGLFKLYLQDKLNVIMPYYNELYKSTVLEFNPLYDGDYYRSLDKNGNTSTDNNRTVNGTTNKVTANDSTTDNTGTVEQETGYGKNIKDVVDKTANQTLTHGMKTVSDIVSSEKMDSTTGGTQKTDGSGTNAFNDTPQGGLSDIQNLHYLTTYTQTSDTNNQTVSGTENRMTSGNNTNTTTTSGDDVTITKNNENRTQTTSGTDTATTTNNLKTKITGTENENTTNDATEHATGNIDTTEKYIEHVAGKRSGYTYSRMIQEFRDTLINIDEMIIKELRPLFMLLW